MVAIIACAVLNKRRKYGVRSFLHATISPALAIHDATTHLQPSSITNCSPKVAKRQAVIIVSCAANTLTAAPVSFTKLHSIGLHFIPFLSVAIQPTRSLYSWLRGSSHTTSRQPGIQIASQQAPSIHSLHYGLIHFSLIQSTRCPCCAHLRVL